MDNIKKEVLAALEEMGYSWDELLNCMLMYKDIEGALGDLREEVDDEYLTRIVDEAWEEYLEEGEDEYL